MVPVKREIEVFCIGQSRINRKQMKAWLNRVGAKEFADKLPLTEREAIDHNAVQDLPGHEATGEVTDAELLVGVGGKRCYNSFEVGLNPNVTKIREDWSVYLDNILQSGHGSVTEHTSWTWAIEGCTRVMTAEANRHRAGVGISEASMRYIRLNSGEGVPYWEPLMVREAPADPGVGGWDDRGDSFRKLEQKKRLTRQLFERVFNRASEEYAELERIWAEELAGNFHFKKQLTSMFRRTIPIGVSTGAIYTLNTRALRHVMTMRCSPGAEEEIAYAFGMIAKEMFSTEPRLFSDFVQVEGGFWRPKYLKV